MTIIIAFHTSNHRNFKNYYKGFVSQFYRSHFPVLLSYIRFLEMMPKAIAPLSSYFTTIKEEATGSEFIDSTSIKVCHNLRIPRHKTFLNIAGRGKGTMGWFYGFKLHLVTNYRGEVVDAKLTTGNVHDTKPVMELSRNLTEKLYADKGYISKNLTEKLKNKGVDLVTTVRRNMKAKTLSLWDKAMLSRQFIIETINVN
ncbi:IS982 family transposase [Thalassomonas haliotis]|uniref:IS982 family transposase n=1 Tax=Thalassomonas haliotis TaxID=485448 RepID=A0ABY7VDS2_9GAMM|nr:IS982 family transposase [Thalassomonas haliotis]